MYKFYDVCNLISILNKIITMNFKKIFSFKFELNKNLGILILF